MWKKTFALVNKVKCKNVTEFLHDMKESWRSETVVGENNVG